MDLPAILAKFEEIKARTDKLAMLETTYWSTIAPHSFDVSREYDEMTGFLDGVELGLPEIGRELKDWLWTGYSIPGVWEKDGKSYPMTGYEDFKAYLLDVYL